MPISEYKVVTFNGGEARKHDKVSATSHLQAMKMADNGLSKSHMLIVGKTIKRYVSPKKQVTGPYNVCKVLWKGVKPSIILMIGNVPEVYKFTDKYARDKIFEEMNKCITSMSAGSAKAEAELTDIIVSLDEISGIRSTSTSKKTSSGSATSVTWKVGPTPESTGKNSGTRNAEDTDTSTWSDGSSRYPSKVGRTFLATLNFKKTDSEWEWPGINTEMMRMNNKTYEFIQLGKFSGKNTYKTDVVPQYIFIQKWLDPQLIYGKVKKAPAEMNVDPDKVFALTKCSCGCGLYYGDRHYFRGKWIETGYGKADYDKQNLEKRGTRNS